jgi:hypothetical protein
MESLLRLSGLLSEDDAGATDLGTLEKRLAEKTVELGKDGTSSKRNSGTPGAPNDESVHGTPRQGGIPSPAASGSTSTSPEPTKTEKKEGEVEALSDMMCSLVTNNCGETRYIGLFSRFFRCFRALTGHRVFIWILYFLTQGHSLGE